jgi:hypothetical protein
VLKEIFGHGKEKKSIMKAYTCTYMKNNNIKSNYISALLSRLRYGGY